MKKFRTIFLGTPDFSLPSLELLSEHPNIELIGVATMPDRPAGRGQQMVAPPVAQFARAHRIPLVQHENINKSEDFWAMAQNVDLIVVLAFAQFLGKKVLALPKVGCFNIHTSLLPKYRGAAPIQYALLNGDKSTGVSIQKMVKKMDAGDICYAHEMPIAPDETGGQLYTRLKFAAALALNDFLLDVINDRITYTSQDESQVSFAPTISKEMGHLKFVEESFEVLRNKVRAFDPWPGTFCFLNEKRLKVFRIEKANKQLVPGSVDVSQNQLLIGALDGAVRLAEVQLAGKKRCSDIELLNGLKNSTTKWSVQ